MGIFSQRKRLGSSNTKMTICFSFDKHILERAEHDCNRISLSVFRFITHNNTRSIKIDRIVILALL